MKSKSHAKQGPTNAVTTRLQGLHAIHQQHDCSHVHLRLSFKRGLHPFYPPSLDLLHPRFVGPANGALASHPVAQLQYWDPWGTLRELAAKLESFLQVLTRLQFTWHGRASAVAHSAARTLSIVNPS